MVVESFITKDWFCHILRSMYFPHTFENIRGSINLWEGGYLPLITLLPQYSVERPNYNYAALLKIGLGSCS